MIAAIYTHKSTDQKSPMRSEDRMHGEQPPAPTVEEFSCLYRYFDWSERMLFHSEEFGEAAQGPHGAADPRTPEFARFPYRAYWYAGTRVVVEGWNDLGLRDAEIDELLEGSPHVESLRRYRNGVFHFQSTYAESEPKFLEFTDAGSESAEWIRRVTGAFRRWFSTYASRLDRQDIVEGELRDG